MDGRFADLAHSQATLNNSLVENAFVIDVSRAPIIEVRYPPLVTIESYSALFDHYVELCRTYSGIAWLIDMRDFNPETATPAVRRAAADVFARAKRELSASTLCEARFTESAAVLGVLTAFDWLTAGKWPCKNFGTREAAEAWLNEMVAQSTGVSPERT